MKKACSFVFFWKKTWSWRVVRKRFPLFIFFRSCGIVSLSTAKSMFSILNSAFFHKPLWNRTLGGCFLLEKKSSFKAKTLWKIFLIFWLIHSNTFHFDHFRMRILSFSKSFSKRFCFETDRLKWAETRGTGCWAARQMVEVGTQLIKKSCFSSKNMILLMKNQGTQGFSKNIEKMIFWFASAGQRWKASISCKTMTLSVRYHCRTIEMICCGFRYLQSWQARRYL